MSKSGWYFTNEMAKGLCLVFCYIWILPSFLNPPQLPGTLALASPATAYLPMSHFFLRQGRVVLPMGGQRQEAQLEIFFGRGRDLGPETGPNEVVCAVAERTHAGRDSETIPVCLVLD